jgi:hypothetical protein
MEKKKSKLVLMVTPEELILTAFLTWAIEKFLDFVWSRGKARIKLEGNVTSESFIYANSRTYAYVGLPMVQFMFVILLGEMPKRKRVKFSRVLRDTLVLHKKCHKYIGNKPCGTCSRIAQYKSILEKHVSDPALYPPFHSFQEAPIFGTIMVKRLKGKV